jgi:hypothetical protein
MFWGTEVFPKGPLLQRSKMAGGLGGRRGTTQRSTWGRCPMGFMSSINGQQMEAPTSGCTSFRPEGKSLMVASSRRPTMQTHSPSSSSAMRFVGGALGLAGLLIAQLSIAAPVEIACPPSVPATAIQVRLPSSEWVPFIDDAALLVGANASGGPPGSFATLVGDPSTRTAANTQLVVYRFDRTHLHDGNWIECIYGGRPEISLYRRLEDDVSECTIETRRRKKNEAPQVRIVCKNG